jgi:hypothetical protein
VVNLPIAGTDVKWVITANQETNPTNGSGTYVMLVSLENVCSINEIGCRTYQGIASNSGTAWNGLTTTTNCAVGSATGRCNQLASLKVYNYLKQMDNVYNNLPDTIGNLPKDNAILDKEWDMDGFNYTDDDTPTTRYDNYNAPITKRVNLISAYEWQEAGLDDGIAAPTVNYYDAAEPVTNSVGDLWCRAQYGTPGTIDNGGDDNNCLNRDFSYFSSGLNYLWLRSAASNNTYYAWLVLEDEWHSLFNQVVHDAKGVFPAIWLSATISVADESEIAIGSGTKTNPYCLIASDPLCSAHLEITTTTGSTEAGITLSGTAKAIANDQDMRIWADACNTAGQCLRKEFTSFDSATSGTAQSWTLSWLLSELPAGTYSGTIWVGLATSTDGNIIDTLSAQSESVNFTLASTIQTYPVTVFKNQPFSLDLGALTNYDLGALLLPTTDHGVTATSTASHLILSSPSGLAAPTTATFGHTAFTFALQNLASGIIELNLE